MLYSNHIQWRGIRHLLKFDKSSENNKENKCVQHRFSHPPQQFSIIVQVHKELTFFKEFCWRDRIDYDTQDGYQVSSCYFISPDKK
jgi:hypothetical protein